MTATLERPTASAALLAVQATQEVAGSLSVALAAMWWLERPESPLAREREQFKAKELQAAAGQLSKLLAGYNEANSYLEERDDHSAQAAVAGRSLGKLISLVRLCIIRLQAQADDWQLGRATDVATLERLTDVEVDLSRLAQIDGPAASEAFRTLG